MRRPMLTSCQAGTKLVCFLASEERIEELAAA